MGHRVVYFGEPSGSRTRRAAELAPADLDVGFVDPQSPSDIREAGLKDAEALITNGLLWTEDDIVSYLKTARNDVLESFGPMNEVILKMIDLIMLIAPVGVFALLASQVTQTPTADVLLN